VKTGPGSTDSGGASSPECRRDCAAGLDPGGSPPGSSPAAAPLAVRRRLHPLPRRILLLALLAGVLTATAVADPALAAGTSQVGQNVGREVSSWARAIMLGVAGLVAIPVLARRDVAGGLVLALLVVIVGGFVFAPTTVESAITGLWHAIAG
jgi:hypothetical protein